MSMQTDRTASQSTVLALTTSHRLRSRAIAATKLETQTASSQASSISACVTDTWCSIRPLADCSHPSGIIICGTLETSSTPSIRTTLTYTSSSAVDGPTTTNGLLSSQSPANTMSSSAVLPSDTQVASANTDPRAGTSAVSRTDSTETSLGMSSSLTG